ncbi:MAG: hypothetical protein JNK05_27640 [Myxococcales bacterium]|nr:hypothetical protein [Myxococcales bacterium]
MDRWSRSLVDEADALCAGWSERFALPTSELAHHELAGLAAALDELAECAESELLPERSRRWFSGEPVRVRFDAPESRALRVPEGALPAAPLALAACAFVAGSSVSLQVARADHASYERALACARADRSELAIDLADPTELEATVSPLLGVDRPSIAWLDAPELARAIDPLCARLERAARYRGGARRGALRWVAGRAPIVDALFARGAPWASAANERASVRGVWIERASMELDRVTLTEPTLVVESFESERAWVDRALALAPFAACSAFGRDKDRLRSLAARTRSDTIFIDSTPACALGGILRAEFDARRWLREVTREVPVVHGAPPAVAAVSDSPARRRWLRGWLRIALGRYGLGGRVEDLW